MDEELGEHTIELDGAPVLEATNPKQMTKHAKANSGMSADDTDPADSSMKSLSQHKKSGYGLEAKKENIQDKIESQKEKNR
jgi:hypothetical protein